MDKPKPNKLVVGHGAIVEYAKTVLKGEITIGQYLLPIFYFLH